MRAVFFIVAIAMFAGVSFAQSPEVAEYNAYWRRADADLVDSLKAVGYAHVDALEQLMALSPLFPQSPTDADLRARIDKFVDEYPVAAFSTGWALMRYIGRNREFDRYVDGIAEKTAAYDPVAATRIAVYIANNYLITQANIVAADPWVNRYLDWSGDPNYQPEMTKVVKQGTGEWEADGVGRLMPDIELYDLEGNKVRISDLRGTFVLIDFWASWCGPCRMEIPHIKEAYEKVKGAPVKFVSISSDRSDEAWKKAVGEIDVPWLNLSSNGTDMLRQYGIKAIPRIMVLDPEGRLAADHITGQTIEMHFERLARKYDWKY